MARRPRMRPTFEIRLPDDGQAALRQLDALLGSGTTDLVGQVLPRHAVVQLPHTRRSWLSPFLNLELVDREGAVVLRGRFSPHPNVWTGFTAVYAFVGMVGTVCTWYGCAQWTMGESPWALLGAPAAVAIIAFVYGAAVIGQGLTADDMHDLRSLVEEAVRTATSHSSGGPESPLVG